MLPGVCPLRLSLCDYLQLAHVAFDQNTTTDYNQNFFMEAF